MKKKEIVLDKKLIQFIIVAVVLPIFITLILQHFGKFTATSLGETSYSVHQGSEYKKIRLHTRKFETLFGNLIEENLYHKDIPVYREDSKSNLVVSPLYRERIPYYFKGLISDIIYPLALSIVLIIIYLLKRKFTLKIS